MESKTISVNLLYYVTLKSTGLSYILPTYIHSPICWAYVYVCVCVCTCTRMFNSCFIFFLVLFFFFFLLFRVVPMTYRDSQARGQIGAVAAGLGHSQSNSGSKPGIKPSTSWFLVISAVPRWELLVLYFQ